MPVSLVVHVATRRRVAKLLLLAATAVLALTTAGVGPLRAEPMNQLVQLGESVHDDGNDLSQLALALHTGLTYLAGDGSVRTILGDGSVRVIAVGPTANAVLCFHNVTTRGDFRDGTSNTVLFSESVGLQFTGGQLLGPVGARGIIDGTSNTIILPENPLTQFCIDDVRGLDPVQGPQIGDGTSNTISFGENSSFDLCLTRAALPSIRDGTSNTIVLGETRNNVCFTDVGVSPDITVVGAVPEPGALALVAAAALALALRRRRRARARRL